MSHEGKVCPQGNGKSLKCEVVNDPGRVNWLNDSTKDGNGKAL